MSTCEYPVLGLPGVPGVGGFLLGLLHSIRKQVHRGAEVEATWNWSQDNSSLNAPVVPLSNIICCHSYFKP